LNPKQLLVVSAATFVGYGLLENTFFAEDPLKDNEGSPPHENEEMTESPQTESNSELIRDLQRLVSNLKNHPASSRRPENLLILRKKIQAQLDLEDESKLQLLEGEYEENLKKLELLYWEEERKCIEEYEAKQDQLSEEYDELYHRAVEECKKRYANSLEALNNQFLSDFEAQANQLCETLKERNHAQFQEFCRTFISEEVATNLNLGTLMQNLRLLEEKIENQTSSVPFRTIRNLCLNFSDLSSQIDKKVPFEKSLQQLRKAAEGDLLLASVISSIPPSVAKNGAWDLAMLNSQFQELKKSVRHQSFLPEGAGPLGQVWSILRAQFSSPAKGPVKGASPDAVLARAEFHLLKGEIRESIDELQKLPDSPRLVLQDWFVNAQNRLILNSALTFVRVRIVNQILNFSC